MVFTGCSHHGTLNILAAVRDASPDHPIRALFGGFHLVSLPLSWTLSEDEESVRALGQALLQSGVEKFYTSHCTRSKGYRILKDIMGKSLEYFSVGSTVRIYYVEVDLKPRSSWANAHHSFRSSTRVRSSRPSGS